MENLTSEQLQEILKSDAAQQLITQATQAVIADTTAKYDEKLKVLNDEKERLQLESMNEQERTQFELKKYKEEIEEQKRLINQKALESRANQLISQFDLPAESMELIQSDDEITLTKRATLLSRLIGQSVKKQQQVYPYAAPAATTEKNPWSKEHFNLTEQGRLYKENPQQAREMAAKHGIKLG